MAIFPTFLGKESRAKSPSDDFWYHPAGYGAPTSAGVRVDEKTALKYLTLFSCVSLIAGDIARLPLNLYKKRTDGGKDTITDHRLYDLLHNAPNPETTSFNYREALQGHLLLWGNGYSQIERAPNGRVIALWQLPDPSQVIVERENGQIVYKYKNADGDEVTRSRDEIFHIPGYGFNGLYGLSMISVAREAIGLGMSTEKYGSLFFGQGTQPSGTIEMDDFLGDKREIYLEHLKKGYEGLGKSHKVMLLEGGMKYKPMSIPLNDAQFLDTRNFQKTEICGMYHVPLHKIAVHGSNSNFNNLEQENQGYVDSCIIHWVTRWETQISLQLLTEGERRSGLYFKFNLNALLRGDSVARGDFYSKLSQVGGITPNEIRAKEDMNPIDGGDQSFVMLNMVPLDKTAELIDKQLEDTPAPAPAEPDEEPDIRAYWSQDFSKRKTFDFKTYERGIKRIRKSFMQPIQDAAQSIINRETKAVKNAVNKHLRAKGDFGTWVENFYTAHGKYVDQKLGPILRTYQQQITDFAGGAIGSEVGAGDMAVFYNETIEQYVKSHVRSSSGQIMAIVKEIDLDDMAAAVDKRMDEWFVKRSPKIARDQVSRLSNAAALEAWGRGGVTRKIWQTVGDNCPFCDSLNGKVVGVERNFLNAGDVMYVGDGWTNIVADDGTMIQEEKPDGQTEPGVQALKSRGNKMHPPIHMGCDCIIIPVIG